MEISEQEFLELKEEYEKSKYILMYEDQVDRDIWTHFYIVQTLRKRYDQKDSMQACNAVEDYAKKYIEFFKGA